MTALDTSSFLLEIGTEELPAIPFLSELPNIQNKFQKILETNRLNCAFDFYYTPRRLVILAKEFPKSQSKETLEFFFFFFSITYQDRTRRTAAALCFFCSFGFKHF